MKRSLENGDKPPKKRYNDLKSPYREIELEYREKLLKMSQICNGPFDFARDYRICTILRCMQLAVDQTASWCGLPYELIEYIHELCKHTVTNRHIAVSRHDMLYRLHGMQQINFLDHIPTLKGGLITEILYKFTRLSNGEPLRAKVRHVGLRIASVFFFDERGGKFGFEFKKNLFCKRYYSIIYFTLVVNWDGSLTKNYLSSHDGRIPDSQNHYSDSLAMFEKFPQLHFSKMDASHKYAWLFTQPNELERVFNLVVDSLRETFEILGYVYSRT
jgi:hypothetical protein